METGIGFTHLQVRHRDALIQKVVITIHKQRLTTDLVFILEIQRVHGPDLNGC